MDPAIRLSLYFSLSSQSTEFMTDKFIKQYNYAKMSVLNVKSIKVTNGENKDNIPLQSPSVAKGGGGAGA